MKYYIISGEPSGDLHGSNLMRAIKERDPDAEFRYWGGDHMSSVSEGRVTHIRETSIMGFVEVVKNLRKISRFFKLAKKTITAYNPDRLILIDYPGFNLRMAKWAKKRGHDVTYYISPQLWAWKKGRIKTVRQYVDRMLCILPFEEAFYAEHNVSAQYVGHPLIAVIDDAKDQKQPIPRRTSDKKILAVLPGSRRQEIAKVLSTYIDAADRYSSTHQIIIAGAPNIEVDFYQSIIGHRNHHIEVVVNDTYNLLACADLAIVTSGTATLEAALFGVPQVVCYSTSALNYFIGSRLVDLKYISLVNLILDSALVPELIQDEMTETNIIKGLQTVIADRNKIQEGYHLLRQKLTTTREASEEAALAIIG